MKYTIGKVAKALGVTTQCVRHYESIGIIDSERNEQNQYRTYSRKDAKTLFQTCLYRSMGFSLKDIKWILNECDMDEASDLFEKRIEDVDQQIETLMALRHELVEYRKGFKHIREKLNHVEIIEGDFSFYLILKNKSGHDIPGDDDDFLIQYGQYAPYIRATTCIQTNSIYGNDEEVEYNYGISLSMKAVRSLDKIDELTEHHIDLNGTFAKVNIEVKESTAFAENLRSFVDEIKARGYEPADKIYGVLRFVSLYKGESDIYEYISEVRKVQ